MLTESSKKKEQIDNKTNYLMLNNDINYKNEKILEYKDYESNSIDFEKALKEDKRNFLKYYIIQ